MNKKCFTVSLFLLVSAGVSAQGDGSAGITQATQMVSSYFTPVTRFVYAIGNNKAKIYFSVLSFPYDF